MSAGVPSPAVRDEATSHLIGWGRGDGRARDRLFALVQEDLRSLAAGYLRAERPGHTLQPTALVHEAWLRLIHQDAVELQDKGRFLAFAARAMRQILVDHARARGRGKRGGGWLRVEMSAELQAPDRERAIDLLALDRALERLSGYSERLARLVDLRFFAGLPPEEAAAAMGVSSASLGRDWRAARALLSKYLREELGSSGTRA